MAAEFSIAGEVAKTLATNIADVQDAIVSPGLRSVFQATCLEHDWHPRLRVCTLCGMTQEELYFANMDRARIAGN